MHKLYELKENLMKELEDYSENKKYSKEDVEAIKYITSSVDHLCNIIEDEDGDYSMRSPYMNGNAYNSSYARGRGYSRTRRDSMGRYSRRYSMSDDAMIAELRKMMDDAPDERTRQEFERFISKMESM